MQSVHVHNVKTNKLNSKTLEKNNLVNELKNTNQNHVDCEELKVTNDFTCIYTNVDCLTNKIEELEIFLNQHNIDIAAIAETKPKNSTEDKKLNLNIKGYKCEEDPTGRGTCIYFKENIEVYRYSDIESIFNPSIFCRASANRGESVNIGLVYRSPNSIDEDNTKLNSQISEAFKKLNTNEEKLIVFGDFNYPEINWSNMTCSMSPSHKNAAAFLENVDQNGISQIIDRPTHYRTTQNPTLIDLVLVRCTEIVCETYYEPPFGKSHHQVLLVTLNIKNTENTSFTEKFIHDRGDYDGMRAEVDKVKWDNLLVESEDCNTWVDNIAEVITNAQKTYVPKKKIHTGSNKPKRKFHAPITLLDKIRLKRYAFKQYKKYKTPANYDRYVSLRNQVKWGVRKSQKHKEAKIAREAKQNPKAFFSYVNSKIKTRDGIASLLKNDGSLTKNDEEKAETLNQFFHSVFTEEDKENLPTFKDKTDIFLTDITITQDDMLKALNKLNVNKSQGPDLIHPRVLKELSKQLSYPLTKLFHKCMKEGKVPDVWKKAEVKPIFKKGKRSSPGNYRPVSLTPVICKIFEGFIRDALYKHLINNKLLSNHQFGFCPGRSCTSQLLVTLQQWFQFLDENIAMDAFYMDFKKAFDTVPHERLLLKLRGYGIRGNMLNWIRDFLSGREQYVNVNGSRSSTVPVTSGVPQGSVLGPTLFIYFINDLPEMTDTPTTIFADDTKAYYRAKTDQDQVKNQSCIDDMVRWTLIWLLGFNLDKCGVLHVGKNNPLFKYTLGFGEDKIDLNTSQCEKDLGVYVDPLLNFEKHYEETIKKARNLSYLVMRSITFKTQDIMIPIFKAIIRPILEYGNVVWSPYKRQDIDAIENIQRRYTKCIINMKGLEYEERLSKLKLPSLEYRRIRGDMIETFKFTHDYYDKKASGDLLKLTKNSNTKTNGYKLDKVSFKTTQYQNFFTNRVVNLWNSLPSHIVNSASVNMFKNKIDRHLSRHMYDTKLSILDLKP